MAQQLTGLQLNITRFAPRQKQLTLHFQAAEAGFVTLVVFGPDGAWILSQGEVSIQTGSNTLVWSGLDSTGAPLPVGRYNLEIFGYNQAHRPAATALHAQVEIAAREPEQDERPTVFTFMRGAPDWATLSTMRQIFLAG